MGYFRSWQEKLAALRKAHDAAGQLVAGVLLSPPERCGTDGLCPGWDDTGAFLSRCSLNRLLSEAGWKVDFIEYLPHMPSRNFVEEMLFRLDVEHPPAGASAVP